MGLQFSIQGFFGDGKFGKYFIRWLELSRGFGGCSFNNLNIPDGAHISCLHSSANKVQPSKVQGVGVIIYASWKFLRLGNSPWGFSWLIFGPGIFFHSVGSPRVFWGFRFLSRFDHPCHLKSRVPPGVVSFLFV